MLLMLKITVQRDSSFEHPNQMFKLMDKKIFTILHRSMAYWFESPTMFLGLG